MTDYKESYYGYCKKCSKKLPIPTWKTCNECDGIVLNSLFKKNSKPVAPRESYTTFDISVFKCRSCNKKRIKPPRVLVDQYEKDKDNTPILEWHKQYHKARDQKPVVTTEPPVVPEPVVTVHAKHRNDWWESYNAKMVALMLESQKPLKPRHYLVDGPVCSFNAITEPRKCWCCGMELLKGQPIYCDITCQKMYSLSPDTFGLYRKTVV